MNDATPLQAGARAIQRGQEMKFGTQQIAGGTRFRLWAPQCEHVLLRLEGVEDRDLPMHKLPRGWFELEVDRVAPGDRYRFILPDGTAVYGAVE